MVLGSYPVDIFSGAAKVVLYTVVPAAFVSSVPAAASNVAWARHLEALGRA